MYHFTDLLSADSQLILLFSIAHMLLCISSTGVITACCSICELNLGNKVHTTLELQLALQTSLDTTYLLARSSFRSKGTNWWNNLLITLISSSATKFSRELYNIYFIPDYFDNFVILFVFVYCLCFIYLLLYMVVSVVVVF